MTDRAALPSTGDTAAQGRSAHGEARGNFPRVSFEDAGDPVLREHAQLLSVFDSIDAPIHVSDPTTHRILFANAHLRALLGRDPAGESCHRVIRRRDSPCNACRGCFFLDEGGPSRWEYHDVSLNRDFVLTDRRLRWPDGRDVRFEMSMDVTVRKQEKEDLQRRNALLKAINEVLEEGLRCGTSGEIAPAFLAAAQRLTESAFGLVAEIAPDGRLHPMTISGRAWEMWRPPGARPPHTDGGFQARGFFARVLQDARSLLSNRPESHPDWVGLPEGHPPITAFLGVPLRQGQRTIGIVALANNEAGYCHGDQRDIEALAFVFVEALERKRAEEGLEKSEERYRRIIETADEGIWLLDEENRTTFVNAKMAGMLGCRPEEMLGTSLTDFMDEEGKEIARRQGLPGQQRTRGKHPLKFCRKDGRELWTILSANPVFEEGGRYAGVLGMLTDITAGRHAEQERKRLEQQLLQAQKMESIGTLAAGLAHEINNPINAVLLNVPILTRVWRDVMPVLEKAEEDFPGRKYGGLPYAFIVENLERLITDMGMGADRIATLVKRLKNFARQADHIEKGPVGLNLAVENAVRLARSTITKSGVALELDLDPDLPLVQANLQHLEQIVLNLLLNAAQAIDHPEGRMRVRTGCVEETRRVTLTIGDNGRGIDASVVDKVFDPFVTDRQAEGGTGLGLFVTYNLVQAHGGDILFRSETGKGTDFTVSFPFLEDSRPTHPPQAPHDLEETHGIHPENRPLGPRGG